LELSIHHIAEHNFLMFVGRYQGLQCSYCVSLINLEQIWNRGWLVRTIVDKIWFTLEDAYNRQIREYEDSDTE
jgi:hypothetical protein